MPEALIADPIIDANHTYRAGGRTFVSCTQSLTAAGLIDFAGVPREHLDYAAWRGTLVHNITADLDRLGLTWAGADLYPQYSIEELGIAEPYVLAWEQAKRDLRFSPDDLEQPRIVERDGLSYGMTPDVTGLAGTTPMLIEKKTSAQLEPWWALQTSGYAWGLPPPQTPPWRWQRAAVQLRDDGRYRLVPFNDDQVDRQVFRAALIVAIWKRGEWTGPLETMERALAAIAIWKYHHVHG